MEVFNEMKKRIYISPAVTRTFALHAGHALLSGSVVDTMSVHTLGHEVQDYTIGGSGDYSFDTPSWGNFDWGN